MTHLQSVFGAVSGSDQHQQQQQQQIPQQNSNFCQAMQTKPSGLYNQQSNLYQNQQAMQQACNNNPYLATNQLPTSMACQNPFVQAAPAAPSACYLPANVLEQLRSLTSNTTPIFILPAGIASSGNSSAPSSCCSPTCIPYPMPLPVYHHFETKSSRGSSDCRCASRSREESREASSIGGIARDLEQQQHVCKEANDGAVCSKKNCPASIQLQAMISQLLAIQGVVPSAITRILLKRLPGSSVAESLDEIMERATRCIRQLPKDGLVRELRNSREVTKLLGLYLTSSSTLPRIIPVLTSVQLKCNILKAALESLASSRLVGEREELGVDADEPLDRLLIQLKSEDELRQALAALRERECEERVNASFAACASQRRISEARLAGVQRKIQEVEAELDRRRDTSAARGDCNDSAEYERFLLSLACAAASKSTHGHYDSPDPFAAIRATSSKRLLLKPHVGSPDTTYDKPSDARSSLRCSLQFDLDDRDATRPQDVASAEQAQTDRFVAKVKAEIEESQLENSSA